MSPTNTPPVAAEHHFAPFAAALLAIALLVLMDSLMKGASLVVGAYSALWLRSLMNLAVIGPIRLATRKAPASVAARRVHVRRGVALSLAGLTFFWGLARLPMAEALALSFIAPIIALGLAALLLGERIERRAIIASLMGLAGVAVIALTRPDAAAQHPQATAGIIAILVSTVSFAWNLVLQRQQALLARPVEVATWHNLMMSILLAAGAPFFLEWPQDAETWLLIAGAGALSMTGAMLFAWAYRRAEAQKLVPLEYTGFVWAALFGWLFFAESVRAPVLAGAVLIVLGCWIAAPRRPLRKRTEQSAL